MNKWVKRKWVRALRSGEYEQTQGCLVQLESSNGRDKGHCCLGVLACEMVPEFVKPDPGYMNTVCHINDETDFLPDELAALWGLSQDDQNRLATQNDDRKSFAYIADWIEENL